VNYDEFLGRLCAIQPTDEHVERSVFVVDEEGFVHVPKAMFWDPENGCFMIRTEFKNKNGDIV
jgi:hypothetical protein